MPNSCFRLQLIIIAICIYGQMAYAQVGVGTFGIVKYPGLLKSNKYDIRFKTGIGYGFFVRHDVLKLETGRIDFRYIATISEHPANLPGGLPENQDADYSFSNFSIDVIYIFTNKKNYKYYAGLSMNMLRTVSKDKIRFTYNGSAFYPALLVGWDYNFIEGFNLFAELNTSYGSTDKKAGPEEIPITGISFLLGVTMYISEE